MTDEAPSSSSPGADLVVAADMVVAVAYELFDERGKLVDRVTTDAPLTYVHGYAQVVPGLEAALEGCELGERLTLRLPPDEAFGERDEAAVLEIDRHDFAGGEHAKVGDELVAEAPDGTTITHQVVEIGEDELTVDLNHPLAGQTVLFEAMVCALRPASDVEIDQARAEADERIAIAGAIVYDGDPDARGAGSLVQLRGRSAPEKPASKTGTQRDEEQP